MAFRRCLFTFGFLAGWFTTTPCFAVTQLTDHVDPSCAIALPSSSTAGSLAFESSCDLSGGNADLNREIFRIDDADGLVQLTQTEGCTNSHVISSAAGDILAFESDCDFGVNADGNVEIVVLSPSGTNAITATSPGCDNLAPSLARDGTAVAFNSDCDLVSGSNADRSVEIFRTVIGGATVQLTDDRSGTDCANQKPSANEDGSVIAFESDCDLIGENEDQVNEIFTVDGSGIRQLTHAPLDTCSSTQAVIDGSATAVAFASTCDFIGANSDESLEIFKIVDGTVEQLSSDGGDPMCESADPRISADGAAVAFESYCDPLGLNGDGSFEVFLAAGSDLLQVSSGTSCSSYQPAVVSADLPLAWVSDCDPLETNADGSAEIFSDSACACGAPRTRLQQSTLPTAVDALFTLQASVGTTQCARCECDVNSDTKITATDALTILKAAVGQDVSLTCS